MIKVDKIQKYSKNGLVKGLLNEGINNHEDSTSEWATADVR